MGKLCKQTQNNIVQFFFTKRRLTQRGVEFFKLKKFE